MGKSNLEPYSFAFSGDGDIFEMATSRNLPRITTGRRVAPVVAADADTFLSLAKAKQNFLETRRKNLSSLQDMQKKLSEKLENLRLKTELIEDRDTKNSILTTLRSTQEKQETQKSAIGDEEQIISAAEATKIIELNEFNKILSEEATNSSGDVKIEILGHGNRGVGGVASLPQDGVYSSFSDISKSLARKPPDRDRSPLLDKVKEFRLHACYSAEGQGKEEAPAIKLQNALIDTGFTGANVKGYFGAGIRFGNINAVGHTTNRDIKHSYRLLDLGEQQLILRSKWCAVSFLG